MDQDYSHSGNWGVGNMPITFLPLSRDDSELLDATLNRIAARGSLEADRIRRDPHVRQFSEPHAVYDLRAQPVAQGRSLESAELTGFRYFVDGAHGTVAAGEVRVDAQRRSIGVANIHFGGWVRATAEAFTFLQHQPQLQHERFEATFLRFSAVSVMSVWLRAANAGESLIYPLAPAPPIFRARHLYSEVEFGRLILPLAKKRALSLDDEKAP